MVPAQTIGTPPMPPNTANAAAKSGVLSDLAENGLFSAGVGLVGLGAAATLARRLALSTVALVRRRVLVTLEIPSHDRAYLWVLNWLASQEAEAARCAGFRLGPLRLRAPPPDQLALRTAYEQHDSGATTATFALVPGVGSHFVSHAGAVIQVHRERNARLVDLTNGTPWERVAMTTLRVDAPALQSLLAQARDLALAECAGRTVVYISYGPDWRPFGAPRRKRPLESVVIPHATRSLLVSDLRTFLCSGPWYETRGIPYRRGYLLHGSPGSGKSSLVQAIAGHMNYNICLLNLGERGMTDDRLLHLMSNMPPRCILLLEDVDAAFVKRDARTSETNGSRVTFSGLLNALDGIVAAEERVIFMTTNHVDKLDPALIRPGRMDLRLNIGWPTEEQIREMFMRFYERPELVDGFVSSISKISHVPSMAALQGHFIQHKESAEDAIKHLVELEASVESKKM